MRSASRSGLQAPCTTRLELACPGADHLLWPCLIEHWKSRKTCPGCWSAQCCRDPRSSSYQASSQDRGIVKRLWLLSWAGGPARTTPVPFFAGPSRMWFGGCDVCGASLSRTHCPSSSFFANRSDDGAGTSPLAAVNLVKIPSARGEPAEEVRAEKRNWLEGLDRGQDSPLIARWRQRDDPVYCVAVPDLQTHHYLRNAGKVLHISMDVGVERVSLLASTFTAVHPPQPFGCMSVRAEPGQGEEACSLTGTRLRQRNLNEHEVHRSDYPKTGGFSV